MADPPASQTTNAEEFPDCWVDAITRQDEAAILATIMEGNRCGEVVCVHADEPNCVCAILFREVTGRSIGREAGNA